MTNVRNDGEKSGQTGGIPLSIDLPNREIVLFVLGELGGRTAKVDTETVGVECYRRYPSKFGLMKFPEYPDVGSVDVTLYDLKKQKYGRMVRGNKLDGWKLTQEGIEWYEANKERVGSNIEQRHPLERRLPQGRKLSREDISKTITKRLQESRAYQKWKNRSDISIYDFFDAIKIDQYMDEGKYQDVLRNTIQAVQKNDDLVDFIDHLNSLYGTRYKTYFIEQVKREVQK
jgi:hypothetical protein